MSSPVEVRSFCRFCQALCGIVVTVDDDRITRVRGDDEHPISQGYVCPKGRALGAWHHHPDRLDHPLIGRGDQERSSWDESLDDLAGELRRIVDESGPDAVGIFFGTGSSFDSAGGRGAFAFFQALGSRSRYTARTIDTPCRPLVSDLMGGNPNLIPAIDDRSTSLLIFVGSNPVVSHGHLASMTDPVRRLRHLTSEGREVWVLDPRRTETAQLATRHLQLRPGSDYAVLAYAVRELLGPDGGADRSFLAQHADGLERLEEAVAPFDLESTATITGLDTGELRDLVAAIRRHGRLAAVTGTGATMATSANVTEWLTRAVQIVTNSYEQPGGLWFNPGFIRCMDRRTARPSPETLRAVPGPPSRPELSGRYGEFPCAALSDEVEAGNLRALIVVGGNPAVSFPDHERTMEALGRLDVLACVDVVHNETTAVATHVLPAAGQLERADVPDYVDQYQTLVASQFTEAVVAPGGQRKPVWWILATLGQKMGLDVMPPGLDLDTATDADYIATLAASRVLKFG
jgi:anaerobic selenocysteine-containing dehydrogenase